MYELHFSAPNTVETPILVKLLKVVARDSVFARPGTEITAFGSPRATGAIETARRLSAVQNAAVGP
jgi:hypothetical protein